MIYCIIVVVNCVSLSSEEIYLNLESSRPNCQSRLSEHST